MGDRGNIFITDGNSGNGVYLYSHWTGSDLPEILQNVIARGERWNDAPYLTRMIFCAMIKDDLPNESTGFGISATLGDNEHPILYVNCNSQEITVSDSTYSFQQYANLNLSEIRA